MVRGEGVGVGVLSAPEAAGPSTTVVLQPLLRCAGLQKNSNRLLMHRLAAVEHAALRATLEPRNPATERRPSVSDALQSQKSHPVQISTLDGHPSHSSHPMLSQFPNSPSGMSVCDQSPLPREKSQSWNPEWHSIDNNPTHAAYPLDTHMLCTIPTFPAMNPSLRANPRRCPAPCTHPQDHYPSLLQPIHEPELTTRVAFDTADGVVSRGLEEEMGKADHGNTVPPPIPTPPEPLLLKWPV